MFHKERKFNKDDTKKMLKFIGKLSILQNLITSMKLDNYVSNSFIYVCKYKTT